MSVTSVKEIMHLTIPEDYIKKFCQRHHICHLGVFGSAVRDDFGPGSDVDILVEFDQEYKPGLMELVEMQEELGWILGRKVDLVERKAVEKSENYIRREHILKSVEPVYVAR